MYEEGSSKKYSRKRPLGSVTMIGRYVPKTSAKRARLSYQAKVKASLAEIESKYLDVYASALAVPAPTDCSGGEMQPEGGCTDCLSAPAVGDGQSNRDGKKIVITKCFVSGYLNYTVQTDKSDPYTVPTTFVALVQDKQTNGNTITSENVYTNPNDIANVNAYPLRNLLFSKRYKVLDTQVVQPRFCFAQTDGANTMSCDANGVPFTLNWKGLMEVNFNSQTTADVAAVVDNSIHLIAFCTATTNSLPVTLSYNSRIRFQG